jgi:hypothetical protein
MDLNMLYDWWGYGLINTTDALFSIEAQKFNQINSIYVLVSLVKTKDSKSLK